ncbi:MAG: hypothetical protein ACKO4Q_12665 [Planctomycetota bacterium]
MEPTSLRSPICAEIRSKKYFFLQSAPMQASDVVDNSNDCWCNRTCDRVGPDGDGVHPTDCTAERSCFRPIFTPAANGLA